MYVGWHLVIGGAKKFVSKKFGGARIAHNPWSKEIDNIVFIEGTLFSFVFA